MNGAGDYQQGLLDFSNESAAPPEAQPSSTEQRDEGPERTEPGELFALGISSERQWLRRRSTSVFSQAPLSRHRFQRAPSLFDFASRNSEADITETGEPPNALTRAPYVPGESDAQPGNGSNHDSLPLRFTIASGEREKARDIIAAIQMLKKLEQEGRPATSQERLTLSRFAGFGPVALSIFPDPITGQYKDAGWREGRWIFNKCKR